MSLSPHYEKLLVDMRNALRVGDDTTAEHLADQAREIDPHGFLLREHLESLEQADDSDDTLLEELS